MRDIDDMISDELAAVINQQIAMCDWREGYPVEVFELLKKGSGGDGMGRST